MQPLTADEATANTEGVTELTGSAGMGLNGLLSGSFRDVCRHRLNFISSFSPGV